MRSLRAIAHAFQAPVEVENALRILVLGGSNSSDSGWVQELRRLAPEHEIENGFLGAVGSLFGLLRLLKRRQDGARPVDLVIFEYALNDTILFIGHNLHPDMIPPTLDDVATLCARDGIPLLFLCLCVRPPAGQDEAEASRYINQIYVDTAAARGAAPCILQREVLGKVDFEQYSDQFHLKPVFAARMAAAVAERLRPPLPVPLGADRALRFLYLPASRAALSGAAERSLLGTPVFVGPSVRLRAGGRLAWRQPGRLIALLVCVTALSGDYTIRARGWRGRKTAQSLARENRPLLVALHYLTHPPPRRGKVSIELPASDPALQDLRHDFTLMEAGPTVPYERQSLEICGAIFDTHHDRFAWVRRIRRLVAVCRPRPSAAAPS